ncbi:IS630 transposase-related protein [Chroococcus sp. FPU101]|uniref:helix-turn-helix domain-containing protein n=1 Tax=Chroococcus sp. FPU101 TaxID=1974212 RepID=UPI001A8E99F7|nr:IS630 transposase-related protein [Chroococcus sp. FPU101]GFE70524.1 hypothetical protein CFPU101_31340 [Chroococcus sp. FPU101]
MKPYSTDFRQKILETKQKTGESIQETAELSSVSYSFVQKLLKRYEEERTVEPFASRRRSAGQAKAINRSELEKLVFEDNDATLQQLCIRLEEKTGVKISVPTMCRLLQKLELNRKKKTLHALRVRK